MGNKQRLRFRDVTDTGREEGRDDGQEVIVLTAADEAFISSFSSVSEKRFLLLSGKVLTDFLSDIL